MMKPIIVNGYVIKDCGFCDGNGRICIISDDSKIPPRYEPCSMCKGIGLVRIPLDSIPIIMEKRE